MCGTPQRSTRISAAARRPGTRRVSCGIATSFAKAGGAARKVVATTRMLAQMRWRTFISVSNLRSIEFPLPRADHSLRPHPLVELLLGNVAQRQRSGLERGAFAMRMLGDRGGLVVTDMRVQRRHQHQ